MESKNEVIQYAPLGDETSKDLQAARSHNVVAGIVLNQDRDIVIGGVTHEGKLFKLNPAISLENEFNAIDSHTQLPNRLNNTMPIMIFENVKNKKRVLNQILNNPNTPILTQNEWKTLEKLIYKPANEALVSKQLLPSAIQYIDQGDSRQPKFIPIVSRLEQQWTVLNNTDESSNLFKVRWNDLRTQISQQPLPDLRKLSTIYYECMPWLFYILHTQDGPGLVRPCKIQYEYTTAFSLNIEKEEVSISDNLDEYLKNCPSRLILLPFHFVSNVKHADGTCNVLLIDRVRKTAERFSPKQSKDTENLDFMVKAAISFIPPISDFQYMSPMQFCPNQLIEMGQKYVANNTNTSPLIDPSITEADTKSRDETSFCILFWCLYFHLRMLVPDMENLQIVEILQTFLLQEVKNPQNFLLQYFKLIQTAVPDIVSQPVAFRMFQKQYSIPWFYNEQDASRFHHLVESTVQLKQCHDEVWEKIINCDFTKSDLSAMLDDITAPPNTLIAASTRLNQMYDKFIHSIKIIPKLIIEQIENTNTFKMVYVTDFPLLARSAPHVGILINPNFQTFEFFDPLAELSDFNGNTKYDLVKSLIDTCKSTLGSNYTMVENGLDCDHLNYKAPGMGKEDPVATKVNAVVRRCYMHLLYLRFVLVTSAIPSVIIAQLLNREPPMLLLRLLCHDLSIFV